MIRNLNGQRFRNIFLILQSIINHSRYSEGLVRNAKLKSHIIDGPETQNDMEKDKTCVRGNDTDFSKNNSNVQ